MNLNGKSTEIQKKKSWVYFSALITKVIRNFDYTSTFFPGYFSVSND
jgi:hypothetical protein